MSKQKLAAARELIKEKHYAEARALLKTIDHPTARDWLAKLDKIAPEKRESALRKLLLPRRGRSRLYWILVTVFACIILYACGALGQIVGIIPTMEELNATRTVEASTQVAARATQDNVRQMTADAQATIIALTPPTATATITDTPTITNTPAPSLTPTPKPFNPSEYQRQLADWLSIAAGGRNLESIAVIDGRSQGGERSAIISYLTTESTEVGYVDEWIDIFEAVAGAMNNHKMNLDSISLAMGTATGMAVGTITVSANDLQAFYDRKITRGQFLSRLQTVSF